WLNSEEIASSLNAEQHQFLKLVVATNAADVGGLTLHTACGLNREKDCLDTACRPDTARRIAFWRWLLVEEVGMVSARLLAQVDLRIRGAVPAAAQWKYDDADTVRRDPLVDHGQNIFWHYAVQGVTELFQRERCKDDWWNQQVVDQMRTGDLSDENIDNLHGRPVEGCNLSAEESRSRQRVVDGPWDPRLQQGKFVNATVIVPNNDAKYQINKDRAMAYAQHAKTPLEWSVAQDKAGAETLQTQVCDKATKIRWLQYHDMETEGLCGMLPLAIGMPVALTQHVDRSQKSLLKGRTGYVHSWFWKENEQQPRVVYVKFEGAQWTLDGTTEPGLYPILPVTRTWKLDKNRKPAVLKVHRKQIPLVPAFAITAHASQGKTLPLGQKKQAVVLDLNVDSKTHAAYGTVVASRVRSRHDVLI
ncbi:pfh1, partial [Symbiodinium pilosum]